MNGAGHAGSAPPARRLYMPACVGCWALSGNCSRCNTSDLVPALPSASRAFFVLAGFLAGSRAAYSDCSPHQVRNTVSSRQARRADDARVFPSLAAQRSMVAWSMPCHHHGGQMVSPRLWLCRYGRGNAGRPSVDGARQCRQPILPPLSGLGRLPALLG